MLLAADEGAGLHDISDISSDIMPSKKLKNSGKFPRKKEFFDDNIKSVFHFIL